MKQFNEHITHISVGKMQAYLDASLNSSERHFVEKHLLDCDLCTEAMEGLELLSGLELTQSNNKLQDRLKNRISSKSVVIRWSIAASISLLLVYSVYLVFNIIDNENALSPVVSEKSTHSESDANESILQDSLKMNGELLLSDNSSNKEVDELEVVEQIKKTQQIPKPKIITKALLETASEKNDIIEENFIALNDEEVPTEELLLDDAEIGEDIAKNDAINSLTLSETEKEYGDLKNAITQAKSVARNSFSSDERNHNKIGQEKFLIQSQRVISGIVTSEEDGLPIPRVNVIPNNSTNGTVTDLEGQFTLELAGDTKELIFSIIGMETSIVDVDGRNTINVIMSTDLIELSEVVLTAVRIDKSNKALGYAIDNTRDQDRKPEPSIGFTAYKKYLKDSLQYPLEARTKQIEGKVRLDFNITEKGEIQNIEIKKRLGYGCDEEAIRLLIEGASWNNGIENGIPISMKSQLTVYFKI